MAQSLWFYCANFYRRNIQHWKYMTANFIMIHPSLKIHECRWWCVFSTHIESTLSSHINISFVSCVHFQNHSALLTLFACQKMLLCDRKISLKTFELIEGRKTIYATTFDNKIPWKIKFNDKIGLQMIRNVINSLIFQWERPEIRYSVEW